LVQRQIVARSGVAPDHPALHAMHVLDEGRLEMQAGLGGAPLVLPELGDDSLLCLVDHEDGAEAQRDQRQGDSDDDADHRTAPAAVAAAAAAPLLVLPPPLLRSGRIGTAPPPSA